VAANHLQVLSHEPEGIRASNFAVILHMTRNGRRSSLATWMPAVAEIEPETCAAQGLAIHAVLHHHDSKRCWHLRSHAARLLQAPQLALGPVSPTTCKNSMADA